jgi:hypothetical protein
MQNSTIIAEHKVRSTLSIAAGDDHELTPSSVYTEFSIHRVYHPTRIVWFPFIPKIMNWPLNDGFVSGIPACKISPPASCL